jgi:glycosyltransferase involved in cell wall biosynthesis
MKEKKKLWIVTELFYPDETATAFYLTGIANHIAEFQTVNIICGAESYEKNTNLVSTENVLSQNINITRVNTLSLDKNKLISRLFRFIYITISISFQILKKVKRGDDIWLVTNPAFLLPIAVIISKIKYFNLTILVHDVFPENLIPIKLIKPKNIIYKVLKYVFDKSYSSVKRIIVCGRDMSTLFEQKIGNKKKIILIENWADTDTIFPNIEIQNKLYEDLGLKNKIIFQYAGNLGRCQGLEELIDIISKCTNPQIHFVFIGEGALKNILKFKAESLGLNNVTFLNSFHRSLQNVFLNECNVAIVTLYDSMLGLGVPSKSYNIMAAGKPILYLGNEHGEIGKVIKENDIGWQFESSQSINILEFLNQFDELSIGQKGINSRKVAEEKYSRKLILKKYEQLIN